MIKQELIEELYGYQEDIANALENHMDVICENDIKSEISIEAYHKIAEARGAYAKRMSKLAQEIPLVDYIKVEKMVEAVYPQSVLRCMRCLEILGVEVAWK